MIGTDYHRPQVRLPGTAGLGDMGSIGKTLYYWNPNHNPRALVEKVDFVSCAGYLGGGDERADLEACPAAPNWWSPTWPSWTSTRPSKRMRVKSVHPGVTVEQVQAATGFELALPEDGVARDPGADRANRSGSSAR